MVDIDDHKPDSCRAVLEHNMAIGKEVVQAADV